MCLLAESKYLNEERSPSKLSIDAANLQSERRVRFSADEQSLRSVQISLFCYSEVSESNASQAANYNSITSASAGRRMARKGVLKVRQDSFVASASGGDVSENDMPRGLSQAKLMQLNGMMDKAGKLFQESKTKKQSMVDQAIKLYLECFDKCEEYLA